MGARWRMARQVRSCNHPLFISTDQAQSEATLTRPCTSSKRTISSSPTAQLRGDDVTAIEFLEGAGIRIVLHWTWVASSRVGRSNLWVALIKNCSGPVYRRPPAMVFGLLEEP